MSVNLIQISLALQYSFNTLLCYQNVWSTFYISSVIIWWVFFWKTHSITWFWILANSQWCKRFGLLIITSQVAHYPFANMQVQYLGLYVILDCQNLLLFWCVHFAETTCLATFISKSLPLRNTDTIFTFTCIPMTYYLLSNNVAWMVHFSFYSCVQLSSITTFSNLEFVLLRKYLAKVVCLLTQ